MSMPGGTTLNNEVKKYRHYIEAWSIMNVVFKASRFLENNSK